MLARAFALLFIYLRRHRPDRKESVIQTLLHSLHDLIEQRLQRPFHILASSRTRLKIRAIVVLGKLLGSLGAYSSLVLQIELIANQYDIWIVAVGVRLQLRNPVSHIQKRILARQVKHQYKTHGIAKKRRCQRSKSLLSCLFKITRKKAN